jgi:exosortase
MSTVSPEVEPQIDAADQDSPQPPPRSITDQALDWLKTPYAPPAILIALGITVCFWELFKLLPNIWMSDDGYYSHGFLVPLISGYIIYTRRHALQALPVKPFVWAIVPLAAILWIASVATATGVELAASVCLVASLLLGTWFAAGGRWTLALAIPILYLFFALPIWSMAINIYTNPLQILSTKVAYSLLQAVDLSPYRPDSTTIYLNNFVLDVGVPCSGLKLILSLSAFAVFFMVVARLKLWANVLFAASVLPFALFFNGLRIALIGVVGNAYGENAGMKFHDYSGYITLIICFFLLFKFARILGWKD